MLQRFLDTADYSFGCSNESNIGIYDPVRECFMVVTDEHADGANGQGQATETHPKTRGRACPPPRRREESASTRS
jgi:hypothetical protein